MPPTGPPTCQPCAVAGWTNKGSLFVWRGGQPQPDEWKSALHKFTEERVVLHLLWLLQQRPWTLSDVAGLPGGQRER